ncbi:MAG: glutaredoxin family protein [Solidesulfovibrio sp. DCME]|uniref:glutaredoxin family protein n=1 Tax=Solidesulfovibrio sp. DCME TaxID=3447380 RepID=UPI003D0A95CB
MPVKAFLPPFLAALLLCAALLAPAVESPAAGPKVEIFVTSWCPYCTKTKAYFDGKGIAYTAYDIEKDAAARMRYQKYGQRGVPLVVIGQTVIPGYSVADFEKALAGGTSAAAQPKMIYNKP